MLQILSDQTKINSVLSLHSPEITQNFPEENGSKKITVGSQETLDLKCLGLMPSQASLLVSAHVNLNLTSQQGSLDSLPVFEIWKDSEKIQKGRQREFL